jgi:ankyrin repeat protein
MKKLVLLFVLITQVSIAQKNEFLNRDFWKTNPSIEQVNDKINDGHNPAELNRFGFDALCYALLEQTNNKTLEYLLSLKGNDVNKLTHDGRTYIFWAAYKDNIDFVKHLIKKGAKMNVIDDKGYTIINFAAATGLQNTKIYDLLIENGVEINSLTPDGANALLLIAVNLKDLSFIKYFTDKGLHINDVDHSGNGIFNYAASKDNRKILSDLINIGVPYKNLNKINGNAFLFATERTRKGYNSLDYFKHLEKLGVNPNVKTTDGFTPLHNLSYACKDVPTFEYFMNKGVSLNAIDKDGNNALINASYRNDLKIIELLITHTSAVNHQNKKGITALSNAVKRNSNEVVNLLIKNGADVTVLDKNGNNLMYYLMEYYSEKNKNVFNQKIELLKANGLAVKKTQKNGNTLYHLAVLKNNIALLKEMASFDQDINAQNQNGYTALQKAVMSAKNTEIIKYLLHLGANREVVTEFNETIFDLASENEALKNEDLNFLKI